MRCAAADGRFKIGLQALDLDCCCDGKGVFKLDAQMPNRAYHLCMTQEQLNRPKISCLFLSNCVTLVRRIEGVP